MKLEKWSIISRTRVSFESPEAERICLQGIVEGHYRCADGKQIITSRIVGRNGEKVATVSGSEYELGETNSIYESEFPDARERLLASLQPCGQEAAEVLCYEV